MKKSFSILILAVLLMSCGNGGTKQSDAIDNGYSESPVLFEDSTPQEKVQTDSAANRESKPNAASSSTKSTTRRSDKAHDNMRGFDPASEDDMDDNGMSRYFENNDEEGWD